LDVLPAFYGGMRNATLKSSKVFPLGGPFIMLFLKDIYFDVCSYAGNRLAQKLLITSLYNGLRFESDYFA